MCFAVQLHGLVRSQEGHAIRKQLKGILAQLEVQVPRLAFSADEVLLNGNLRTKNKPST